jgi:hypothetical protein
MGFEERVEFESLSHRQLPRNSLQPDPLRTTFTPSGSVAKSSKQSSRKTAILSKQTCRVQVCVGNLAELRPVTQPLRIRTAGSEGYTRQVLAPDQLLLLEGFNVLNPVDHPPPDLEVIRADLEITPPLQGFVTDLPTLRQMVLVEMFRWLWLLDHDVCSFKVETELAGLPQYRKQSADQNQRF